MKKTLTFFAVLAALFFAAGMALASPANSKPSSDEEEDFRFDYDLVNFAAEERQLSRLECYVKVTYSELQFIKASKEKFRATYETAVKILNSRGEDVDETSFKDDVEIDDLRFSSSTTRFKMNKVEFDLPPGDYQVVIRMEDLETNRKAEQQAQIQLRDYSNEELAVSDILMLDNYVTKGKDMTFRPRVSNEQNPQMKLFAYFEVYDVPPSDSFSVEYEVQDAEKNVVQSEHFRNVSAGRMTRNVVDIATENLMHGSYVLRVHVRDGEAEASTEKPFNWYIAGLPLTFTNIEQAIDALRYIATKKEMLRLKKSPRKKKYTEFVAFWKHRDPTPETAENEYRREYYRRISYANEAYQGFRKEGWKTDRGWVYVMLGPPDSIEREPYNQRFAPSPGRTIKAIEVWVYYKYNRQFVFFDENGFGDYTLENPETLYEIIK